MSVPRQVLTEPQSCHIYDVVSLHLFDVQGKCFLHHECSVLLRSEMITLTKKVLFRLLSTRVGISLIITGGATLHLITGNNTTACCLAVSSSGRRHALRLTLLRYFAFTKLSLAWHLDSICMRAYHSTNIFFFFLYIHKEWNDDKYK